IHFTWPGSGTGVNREHRSGPHERTGNIVPAPAQLPSTTNPCGKTSSFWHDCTVQYPDQYIYHAQAGDSNRVGPFNSCPKRPASGSMNRRSAFDNENGSFVIDSNRG